MSTKYLDLLEKLKKLERANETILTALNLAKQDARKSAFISSWLSAENEDTPKCVAATEMPLEDFSSLDKAKEKYAKALLKILQEEIQNIKKQLKELL